MGDIEKKVDDVLDGINNVVDTATETIEKAAQTIDKVVDKTTVEIKKDVNFIVRIFIGIKSFVIKIINWFKSVGKRTK